MNRMERIKKGLEAKARQRMEEYCEGVAAEAAEMRAEIERKKQIARSARLYVDSYGLELQAKEARAWLVKFLYGRKKSVAYGKAVPAQCELPEIIFLHGAEAGFTRHSLRRAAVGVVEYGRIEGTKRWIWKLKRIT